MKSRRVISCPVVVEKFMAFTDLLFRLISCHERRSETSFFTWLPMKCAGKSMKSSNFPPHNTSHELDRRISNTDRSPNRRVPELRNSGRKRGIRRFIRDRADRKPSQWGPFGGDELILEKRDAVWIYFAAIKQSSYDERLDVGVWWPIPSVGALCSSTFGGCCTGEGQKAGFSFSRLLGSRHGFPH